MGSSPTVREGSRSDLKSSRQRRRVNARRLFSFAQCPTIMRQRLRFFAGSSLRLCEKLATFFTQRREVTLKALRKATSGLTHYRVVGHFEVLLFRYQRPIHEITPNTELSSRGLV